MAELGLCAITVKKYKAYSNKKVAEGLENVLKRDFTTICNWEQGNRIPKTETIKEISEILNVDYKFLKDPK